VVFRRIEFLLLDCRQVASSRATGIRPGGVRTCAFLGAATTILAICPSPDAPISPAPQTRRRIGGGGEEYELRVSLVGVSCVGTTTIGRMLGDRRGCPFFDLDEEVERHFGLSIERLQARFLTGYSYRKECAAVLERVATANPDCVIALPPSGLRDAFLRVVRRVPCVTVAVHDTPENILERITFYDIDSQPIDRHLTGQERILYLKEIKADISYFKRSYERADLQVSITGLDPEASAAAIDARLGRT
jgi:shikimate kinase